MRSAPRCAAAALMLPLAACTAGSRPGAGTGAAAPGAGAAPDASFDWHVLVILPFGAPLTDSPTSLHEVLLFHDEAQGAAGADNAECYSVDAPPRFIDADLYGYLLCFTHDRLNRIEARVALPMAAAQTFARACTFWRSSTVLAAGDDLCAGEEGGIAFSARLDHGRGESPATLSMTLSPANADGIPGS